MPEGLNLGGERSMGVGSSANAETGSRADASSQQAVSTEGFDPARFRPNDYDGKPRHMPKVERRELDALVKAVCEHMDGLTDWRLGKLMSGFMSVSPINCSWQHFGLAELFVCEAASAIEARSGETTKIGSTEGESAVPKADAQKEPPNV